VSGARVLPPPPFGYVYGATDNNGGAACVSCAPRVELIDPAAYREGGDHRGGCGLSCDTCGGVIVAACDPCRDSIEGV